MTGESYFLWGNFPYSNSIFRFFSLTNSSTLSLRETGSPEHTFIIPLTSSWRLAKEICLANSLISIKSNWFVPFVKGNVFLPSWAASNIFVKTEWLFASSPVI